MRAAGAAAVHVREFDADDLASHGPLVDVDHRRARPDRHRGAGVRDPRRPGPRRGGRRPRGGRRAHRLRGAGQPADPAGGGDAGGRDGDRSWCSPRSPGSGCAGPTTSTARPRRAWTGSPAAWPTPCTAPGVRLLIVRPGFVIGRMTEGMAPAPLSSTPAQVAAATARALAKGRRTVWVPWTLRPASLGHADAAAIDLAQDAAMSRSSSSASAPTGWPGLRRQRAAELARATVVYGSRRQLELLDDTVSARAAGMAVAAAARLADAARRHRRRRARAGQW